MPWTIADYEENSTALHAKISELQSNYNVRGRVIIERDERIRNQLDTIRSLERQIVRYRAATDLARMALAYMPASAMEVLNGETDS